MWVADWQEDDSVVLIDDSPVDDRRSGNDELFWILPALLPKQTCCFFILLIYDLISFALTCIKLDVLDFKHYLLVEYKLAPKTLQCYISTNALTMQILIF